MECAICLLEFQEDSAYVPDLGCHCTFIVHEECWNRWTGSCLYCRQGRKRPHVMFQHVQCLNSFTSVLMNLLVLYIAVSVFLHAI